mmetsp:Transcript_33492/g.60507  ORF Transcript_33492/g.60507 Transcript_33492/m.60507 type:complete len:144 (-) Transcript_33492:15-446(-)|eukprot:CAMPEP_0175073502 /NCGR_PEP_ID=MMETSP0052_2-20121109/20612_1 /TAXON_ID=51329 ORGANISM="Polytomella parva, Strain SAG 63-3" /NCGR_SAMPLE_ID=MMETSP0052_2 /ASSEMBLY_ACC=CAM_ASM_000194 /LENGTH=143 /DNA_ID=CAMNT_0016341347 /DNA_START=17 /DNA_END=448 /DNA_ORIENTATION=+
MAVISQDILEVVYIICAGAVAFGIRNISSRIWKGKERKSSVKTQNSLPSFAGDSSKSYIDYLEEDNDKSEFNKPVPLTSVIARCEAKWLLKDLKLAADGDTNARQRAEIMLRNGAGLRGSNEEISHWLNQVWSIQNFQSFQDS